MFTPRSCSALLCCAALAATQALAGPPRFHGGFHGGFRGPSVGGFRGPSVGGFRGGAHLRVLPRGYGLYHHGGAPFYFSSGRWYRPWRGAYLGCYPPVGLCLPLLPLGFLTGFYGGVRYYSYENVYYTDAPAGGYVVADPPPGAAPAPAQPRAGTPDAAALDALLIVPLEGQDEARMLADRAAAQRHALQKSGYDPADSDPEDPGTPRARRAYLRAMRAYLEEKGYSVK